MQQHWLWDKSITKYNDVVLQVMKSQFECNRTQRWFASALECLNEFANRSVKFITDLKCPQLKLKSFVLYNAVITFLFKSKSKVANSTSKLTKNILVWSSKTQLWSIHKLRRREKRSGDIILTHNEIHNRIWHSQLTSWTHPSPPKRTFYPGLPGPWKFKWPNLAISCVKMNEKSLKMKIGRIKAKFRGSVTFLRFSQNIVSSAHVFPKQAYKRQYNLQE